MSADNWGKCPQCKVNQEAEKSTLLARAESKYGKIPAKDYELLITSARMIGEKELDTTLREDYDQRMSVDGVYGVSYGCSCSVCGFSFEYEHNEKVKLKGAKKNE